MDNIKEDIVELDILIGRILELSKLDIHEAPLKTSSFSLSALLEELLARFEPLIAHKELEIKKELLAHPPISGDRKSLHTALLNILDNAAKFSPANGSIRIAMALDKTFIVTSIINTSEKLPEKDLERIFEPFYRSKRSKASGSGLGLSIASKIIERHGGRIRAFNSPDGLEIRVWLPVEKQVRDNSFVK
jgi:signal transduction histidine kinase